MASNLGRRTSTGAFVTGKYRLKSVCLTAAAATSTVAIDDSTDGSATDLLVLSAAANTSVCWTAADPNGVAFGTAIYGTLTGASAAATVEYD